jgi:hypothetical protein
MYYNDYRVLNFVQYPISRDLFLDIVTQEIRNKYTKSGDQLHLKTDNELTYDEIKCIKNALISLQLDYEKEDLYEMLLATQKEQANLQEKLVLILEQQKQDLANLHLLINQPKPLFICAYSSIYYLPISLVVLLVAVYYNSLKN